MSEQQICTIQGYLYGLICGKHGIMDRVGRARIYAVASEREVTGEAIATADNAQAAKPGLKRLNEDELQAKLDGERLVLEGETREDGWFCLRNPDYQGGPVDVYVVIDRVPLPEHEPAWKKLPGRRVFFLGTFLPVASEEGFVLKLVIPQYLWCRLKRAADAWTIAGKVTACANPSVAIGDVTVTAFDVDWVEHDTLGSDKTSASGIYRIDYPGDAYRQAPFIDIELFGGPDVYFKIEDDDSNVLLDEPSSAGRAAGRADRGVCACIDLCVDVQVEEDGPVVPSIWTGIGTDFTIPDGGSLNDFDDDGYADTPKYALWRTIRMTGSAALETVAGNPIEYRFLVSDTTAANSDPPVAAANFTRVVGKAPDENLFASIKVCQMVRFSPFKIVDVKAKLGDLDPDGWLDVNKSIERTFIEDSTLSPLDIPDFVFVDTDGLMSINTRNLTTEPNVPLAGLDPGDAVPAGDRIGVEKFAIRFEVREVIDKATNTFGPMLGDGTTVNALVMNNNPRVGLLAMKEHLETTSCSPLTGSIHVAYTVHHPHLRDVSIRVKSNDGVYNVNLSDPPLPLSGNTSAAITHLHNAALAVPNSGSNVLHKCTYLVTLRTWLRLHTGDNVMDDQHVHTTFYYEP
ncbi:MAG: hypothetical protein GY719_22415 [bacterium]|nr:hypothetical protein [bacterium]